MTLYFEEPTPSDILAHDEQAQYQIDPEILKVRDSLVRFRIFFSFYFIIYYFIFFPYFFINFLLFYY